jgi:protein-disulfide isomerase
MSPQESSTSSPWFAVSMGLLGLIVGYALATGLGGGIALPSAGNPPIAQGGTDNPVVPPTPTNLKPAAPDDDEVKGSASATVTLIEFTDYQCPFCSRHFQQTVPEVIKNYVDTGKVKYVVRDFPLGFHPNAQKASEATECAADQGKFWEMHDKLFNSQGEWSNSTTAPDTFKKYATDLGLNAGTFGTCLDSGKHAEEVKKDMADGQASGIDGTPGFWILGPDDQTKQISGAYPYATFQAAFDEMLK